jgi:hypothetical protein
MASAPDTKSLFEVAYQNPTIKKVVEDEIAFRTERAKELQAILDDNRSRTLELELAKIKKAVCDRVTLNLQLAKLFNEALGTHNPKAANVSWPCHSNKMVEILTGTKELLTTQFELLSSGQIPKGYGFENSKDRIPVLNDDKNATGLGTSKITFLITAALFINIVCKEIAQADKSQTKKLNLGSLSFLKGTMAWPNRSYVVYSIALPQSKALETLLKSVNFEDFVFLNDNQLIIPHNRYGFGAGREKSAHPGKPYDCSSFLSRFGLPLTTTLDHYLQYSALLQGEKERSADFNKILAEWQKKSREWPALQETFVPLKITDPQKIPIGAIYTHCRFNLNTDPKMLGIPSGGHTGFLVGFNSQGNSSTFQVLSLNRDMPKIEGVVVEAFPYGAAYPAPLSGKKVLLFNLKNDKAK